MHLRAERSGYLVSRWLFLRLLGVVYLIAFASLAVQITGLVGERGIMPAGQFLDSARSMAGHRRVPAPPHRLLAGRERRSTRGRGLGRRRPGAPARLRRGAARDAAPAVAALPLAQRSGAGLPLLPVGRAAARGRLPRHSLGARWVAAPPLPEEAIGARAVAAGLPPLQADVPVRHHQARERGSDVAHAHRARLPLPDPAAAALDRLVRPSTLGAECIAPPRSACS